SSIKGSSTSCGMDSNFLASAHAAFRSGDAGPAARWSHVHKPTVRSMGATVARKGTPMTATTSSTTIPTLTVETAELEKVPVNMYRDTHKGLRAELFAVTTAAGSVDPGDPAAVAAVGQRWRNLVHVLVTHAEHEDEWMQPVIERY